MLQLLPPFGQVNGLIRELSHDMNLGLMLSKACGSCNRELFDPVCR